MNEGKIPTVKDRGEWLCHQTKTGAEVISNCIREIRNAYIHDTEEFGAIAASTDEVIKFLSNEDVNDVATSIILATDEMIELRNDLSKLFCENRRIKQKGGVEACQNVLRPEKGFCG